MTDYTPGETNAADDLLDQMLKATHTELLTTIATEQAGTTDNPPFVPRYRHRWLSDLYDLSDQRIDWSEENAEATKLAELLEQIATLLDRMAMTNDMADAAQAKMFATRVRLLTQALFSRTVSQTRLLDVLKQVMDVTDSWLDSELINDAECVLALQLKALLPVAYVSVLYLFDSSDETVSCPVS